MSLLLRRRALLATASATVPSDVSGFVGSTLYPASGTLVSSFDLDVPSEADEGQLLVAVILAGSTGETFEAAGWTLQVREGAGTNHPVLHLLTKFVGASEPSDHTFTLTSGTARVAASMLAFGSAAPGNVASNNDSNFSARHTTPDVTVDVDGSFLLNVWGAYRTGRGGYWPTPDSPFLVRANTPVDPETGTDLPSLMIASKPRDAGTASGTELRVDGMDGEGTHTRFSGIAFVVDPD